jgi:hypothetical protein
VKVMLAARLNMVRVNLTCLPIQQSKYDFLTKRTTTLNHLFATALVHEPSFTTDKGFVSFNRAGHLVNGPMVHGIPQAMKHEPGSLLGNLQIAGDLVRTNAVLAVSDHPHCAEPLIKLDGAVFKDSPDFHRELLTAIKASPCAARLNVRQSLTFAARALWPFRPLSGGNRLYAYLRAREVLDCFHESSGKVFGHKPILRLESV